MSTHSKIQSLLYEYVRGEMATGEAAQVEQHIATCRSCAREVDELKQLVALTTEPTRRPSDERPIEFWNSFAASVERRISDSRTDKVRSPAVRWYEEIVTLLTLKWRAAVAVSGAVSLAVLAIIVWRLMPVTSTPNETPAKVVTQQPPAIAQMARYDARVADYFRRSKMVLIGVTNMRVENNEPADLSTEREVSRQLVHEARYLRRQPIDDRSAELIDDLQKILIELANTKEQGGAPNVDLVRTGVHQENLLFKIRMAESMYDTARFATADRKY